MFSGSKSVAENRLPPWSVTLMAGFLQGAKARSRNSFLTFMAVLMAFEMRVWRVGTIALYEIRSMDLITEFFPPPFLRASFPMLPRNLEVSCAKRGPWSCCRASKSLERRASGRSLLKVVRTPGRSWASFPNLGAAANARASAWLWDVGLGESEKGIFLVGKSGFKDNRKREGLPTLRDSWSGMDSRPQRKCVLSPIFLTQAKYFPFVSPCSIGEVTLGASSMRKWMSARGVMMSFPRWVSQSKESGLQTRDVPNSDFAR